MEPRTMAATAGARRPAPGVPSLLAVAITLAGIGMPFMAQAQQAAQSEADTVVLEPQDGTLELDATSITSNQLGTITEESGSYTPGSIATATRLVLTPRETPQSISVVTRQQMNDFSLNSIDDVMKHTPGVSITSLDSGRSIYSARGFQINTFQYDGIPMTRDSSYSAGNTLSDMAIYDRIEVLKGATGLLTGSGDPGATINLIRKKPTHEFQGHFSLGAGSWDNYRTEVDVSGPLTESGNVRGRAVAAYQDKNTHLDHYNNKTYTYFGTLEFDLSEDTLLTVGADYQDNDPEGSPWGSIPLLNSQGSFNKVSRSFNSGARWSAWEQYTRTVFATLEHTFANGWLGKIQYNHQINGYDAKLGSVSNNTAFAPITSPNPVTGQASYWAGYYEGETVSDAVDGYVSGNYEFLGRDHEFVVGTSLARRDTDRKDYGYFSGTVDDYYGWDGRLAEPDWLAPGKQNTVVRENAIYLASRFNLHDDWKLILGGRLSDYRSRQEGGYNPQDMTETGVFTPYAGLIYDLTENFSLYGSYTTIFKPQSLKGLSGQTLEPLEGENYEIGVKGEFFDGRLNGSVAYFEIEQDNFGISSGLTSGIDVLYRAEQVKVKGYETEISGELAPGWQLQGGYTHKVARANGGKVTTYEPEDTFRLFTSYQLPGQLEAITVGGGARWQSRSWRDVANPAAPGTTVDIGQGAYWVADLMTRYQITEDLSATVNLNNIFDKKYYSVSSDFDHYTWGEPRNVMLTTRYDF